MPTCSNSPNSQTPAVKLLAVMYVIYNKYSLAKSQANLTSEGTPSNFVFKLTVPTLETLRRFAVKTM